MVIQDREWQAQTFHVPDCRRITAGGAAKRLVGIVSVSNRARQFESRRKRPPFGNHRHG